MKVVQLALQQTLYIEFVLEYLKSIFKVPYPLIDCNKR